MFFNKARVEAASALSTNKRKALVFLTICYKSIVVQSLLIYKLRCALFLDYSYRALGSAIVRQTIQSTVVESPDVGAVVPAVVAQPSSPVTSNHFAQIVQ